MTAMTLKEWENKHSYKVYHYPNGHAQLYIQPEDPRLDELRSLKDFELTSHALGMASLRPRRLTLEEWAENHDYVVRHNENGSACVYIGPADIKLKGLFDLTDYDFSSYIASYAWLTPRRSK